MSEAWAGLDDQVGRLVARLRPIGKTIGAQAKAGDAVAQKVIDSYAMLHRRVDPIVCQLTEDALAAWERREDSLKGVENE